MWKVICEPGGDNADGKTRTGLIVYLFNTSTSQKKEVSRVAFVRRHGTHRAKTFKAVLQEQIDHAQHSADTMNRLLNSPHSGSLL